MSGTGGVMVKICGLTDEATVRGMRDLPVTHIGLMFAKSRRQLTPEQASNLHRAAREVSMAGGVMPKIVGVFVNPTHEQLAETFAQVALDVVQLHGDESPDFCREVAQKYHVEVWRVLSMQEDVGEAEAGRIGAYAGAVSAILLDTAGGGTGRTFRWEAIPAYQAEAARSGLPLYIAGGLTPDNVGLLMTDYAPQGVDISSGVETDGIKDLAKIAAFAERVKV